MEDNTVRAADPRTLASIAQLIQALGYSGTTSFVTPADLDAVDCHRHALSRAFAAMGVVGCFGFRSRGGAGRERFTPALYVAAAADGAAADAIHKMVWTQGIVPLLLVGMPDGVQLREAYRFNSRDTRKTTAWAQAVAGTQADPAIAGLTAKRLGGSLAWKDFSPQARDRVDTRLMKAISGLSMIVRQDGDMPADRPDLVNALIGKMIYLFMLVDRGTIDQQWISGLAHGHVPACPDIRIDGGRTAQSWPASQVWALFDALDDELNGSVFPIIPDDRRLVGQASIDTIRRVIRHGDAVAGKKVQAGFLDVSFGDLRTETISAMYELFLKLEETTASGQDGAFYTPPFLADYVLDELEGYAPLDAASRVLDPSAGSGIFLVGCFRRIAEASTPIGGWSLQSMDRLRELLTSCVFGVERHGQAANVARFSLYLTLLDYAGGASLPEIRAALGGERLFPPLSANIAIQDFFDWTSGDRFTHVVGNPPWGALAKAGAPAMGYAHALRASGRPIDNGRVEEAFAWKAISDHVRPSGAVALLMSTRCFVNPAARRFPAALASAAEVVGVTNLSHFRYRLFAGARSPATAAFLRATEADPMAPAWIHVPLLSSQPLAVGGDPWSIIASTGSMSHARHAELRAGQWSRLLMLSPYDRRYAALVVDAAAAAKMNFGAFLKKVGLVAGRGGTAEQTGIRQDLILGGDQEKPNYYRRALGLEARESQVPLPFEQPTYRLADNDIAELKAPFDRLFAGDMLVVTRHMVDFDVVDRPAAFNSTLNLVAYAEPARAVDKPGRRQVLGAIARFLATPLASYLFVLAGKTWLLDARRFEVNDLLQLPFPFDDAADLVAGSSDDPTFRLVGRLGLEDLGFEAAVSQYAAHRIGYKDCRVPRDAMSEPDQGTMKAYLAELKAGLGAMLGPEARLTAGQPSRQDDFASITISIGLRTASPDRRPHLPATSMTAVAAPEGFNSDCEMSYDPISSTIRLTKPLTMTAWTLDKAYSDRMAIIGQIARS